MKNAKPYHHYSGPKSATFWRRVNALPAKHRDVLYSAGVLLQNMEETILGWLYNAEPKPRKRRRSTEAKP